MHILRALAFFFLTQAVLAQQPTPILPDPKLTPGDTFDVTAQDVCVPGYAKTLDSSKASIHVWEASSFFAFACSNKSSPLTREADDGRFRRGVGYENRTGIEGLD
jgi:hypothetical protein